MGIWHNYVPQTGNSAKLRCMLGWEWGAGCYVCVWLPSAPLALAVSVLAVGHSLLTGALGVHVCIALRAASECQKRGNASIQLTFRVRQEGAAIVEPIVCYPCWPAATSSPARLQRLCLATAWW